MSKLTKLVQRINPFKKNIEEKIINQFNEAFLWAVGGGQTQYDADNKTYINDGYNVNSIVYSIINQQATKTASVPYYIRDIKDSTNKKELDNLNLATKCIYTPQQKIKKIILEKKAYDVRKKFLPLERPNTNQTWTEFIALFKTFIKTTGNVYIYVITPEFGINAGTPKQVYILPSHLMQIIIKKDVDTIIDTDPIEGYILIEGRSYIEFKREDVIHIKYSNPNYDESGSHLYGQSPLRAALKNIESSNKALDLNIKTLQSGGAFGLIHAKGTPLKKEQADNIKEKLIEMNNNPEDLSKIAGVSAEIGFTRLSLTSDELKPFDYLKFDSEQIHAVLGWAMDDANRGDFGGTIKEVRKQRITDNILPDLKLLEYALNNEFLPRFKGYENSIIEFDVSELPEMQTDVKELSTWLNTALLNGVITRQEYRLAINYPESENKNLEIFTISSDVLTLEEAVDSSFTVDNQKDYAYLLENKAGFNQNQERDNQGRWSDNDNNFDKYGDYEINKNQIKKLDKLYDEAGTMAEEDEIKEKRARKMLFSLQDYFGGKYTDVYGKEVRIADHKVRYNVDLSFVVTGINRSGSGGFDYTIDGKYDDFDDAIEFIKKTVKDNL